MMKGLDDAKLGVFESLREPQTNGNQPMISRRSQSAAMGQLIDTRLKDWEM